jgi:hypothetical protein
LVHYWCEAVGPAIAEPSVNSVSSRRKTESFVIVDRPQENSRLEIHRSFWDTMIKCIKQHLLGYCAERVFKLDEIEISEWEDRFPRK